MYVVRYQWPKLAALAIGLIIAIPLASLRMADEGAQASYQTLFWLVAAPAYGFLWLRLLLVGNKALVYDSWAVRVQTSLCSRTIPWGDISEIDVWSQVLPFATHRKAKLDYLRLQLVTGQMVRLQADLLDLTHDQLARLVGDMRQQRNKAAKIVQQAKAVNYALLNALFVVPSILLFLVIHGFDLASATGAAPNPDLGWMTYVGVYLAVLGAIAVASVVIILRSDDHAAQNVTEYKSIAPKVAPPEDYNTPNIGFDADAAFARHMARRAADGTLRDGSASQPPRAMPSAPSSFGRRGV